MRNVDIAGIAPCDKDFFGEKSTAHAARGGCYSDVGGVAVVKVDATGAPVYRKAIGGYYVFKRNLARGSRGGKIGAGNIGRDKSAGGYGNRNVAATGYVRCGHPAGGDRNIQRACRDAVQRNVARTGRNFHTFLCA